MLLALSILGIGEIVGALIMSQIIDQVTPKVLGIINVINLVIVWAFAYSSIRKDDSDVLLFFFTFVWGYMDAQVNTHLMTMLAFEFDTVQEPFSIGIMIRSLFTLCLLLFQDFILTDPSKSDL